MRRLLILPVLALASASFALSIGEKAPPLSVEATVKGMPVKLSKGIHVVEFWATWCGPCKVSIPHLTEMANKYKGKVDFTGVSVYERGENQLARVKNFVAEMGPRMGYNVAFDGEKKAMATNWMEAAKQNGIPTAFLVKDGKILWIGHPMDGLDEAVGQVIAGKFDVAASKAKFDAQMGETAKQEKEQAEMAALLKPFTTAYRAKDYPAALKALDEVETKRPDMKPRLESTRLSILRMGGTPDQVVELAKRFAADDYKDDAATLNAMAWSLVDPASKLAPNFEAGLILSKRAAEASNMRDGEVLDTYALALYKTGDKKQALEVQTKAVALAKSAKEFDAASLKDMESRLAMYQKDAS